MSGGKLFKESQVKIKIMQTQSLGFRVLKIHIMDMRSFLQFIFNILWMCMRGLKIHKWIWERIGQRFLSHDKWQVKLLCDFFTIHILHFTNDSNSRNNNS